MVTNNPEVVNNVIGPNIGNQDLMETASKQGNLVPQLINLMSETAPWLVGAIICLCSSSYAVNRSSLYVYCRGYDY